VDTKIENAAVRRFVPDRVTSFRDVGPSTYPAVDAFISNIRDAMATIIISAVSTNAIVAAMERDHAHTFRCRLLHADAVSGGSMVQIFARAHVWNVIIMVTMDITDIMDIMDITSDSIMVITDITMSITSDFVITDTTNANAFLAATIHAVTDCVACHTTTNATVVVHAVNSNASRIRAITTIVICGHAKNASPFQHIVANIRHAH